MTESPARRRYLDRAYRELMTVDFDDITKFLSLRRLVGSATARLYDAIPGGRDELLRALRADATNVEPAGALKISNEAAIQLMQLIADFKDRDPAAIEGLKQVARADFNGYFAEESDEQPRETLRMFMTLAARNDAEVQAELQEFYAALVRQYRPVYTMVLEAAGRRPVDGIGTVEQFSLVLAALFDGLGIAARIEGTEHARKLLDAAIVPLIVGLTVPVDSPPLTEAELLFGRES